MFWEGIGIIELWGMGIGIELNWGGLGLGCRRELGWLWLWREEGFGGKRVLVWMGGCYGVEG